MIVRLVKMVLIHNEIENFIQIFNEAHSKIRKFEGCLSVKLHQEINNPEILFTISEWKSQADLEHYRASALFINTWKKVKPMFAQKAEAFSLKVL